MSARLPAWWAASNHQRHHLPRTQDRLFLFVCGYPLFRTSQPHVVTPEITSNANQTQYDTLIFSPFFYPD